MVKENDMFATKLTIDKRWLHQQSKQTDMLLWMQNHPNKLYDTTITNIVHTMALDKDFNLELTEGSANQVFYALMRRGLVGKDRDKKRANFYINYYHPDLPPIVLEGVPKTNKPEHSQIRPSGVIHVDEIDKPEVREIPMEKEEKVKVHASKNYSTGGNQMTARLEGKKRFEFLQEMERTGALAKMSCRSEVSELVGYPKGSETGTSWVNNLIHRGYMVENLERQYDGTLKKTYRLTGRVPDYDHRRAVAKRTKSRKAAEKVQSITTPVVLSRAYAPSEDVKVLGTTTKVVIEHNGTTVTIENADASYVSEIFNAIK